MKTIYNIIAFLALAVAVSCEPGTSQQEEPIEQTLEFRITSANPMVIPAEGGDFAIDFSITAPDNTLEVSATCDAEWIRVKGVSDENPNTIQFAVEENEAEESRSTTIVVSYDRDYKVTVSQAAAKPEEKQILSTLDHDVEMVMDTDNTLAYADYLGEDYQSGVGVYQFWFLDVVSKRMICLEVLCESQGSVPAEELYIPTGEYFASTDICAEDVLMIGYRNFDADGPYDGGSWYTELNVFGEVIATAPIAEGEFSVEINTNGTTYTCTFDLKDDKGNTIKGRYNGDIAIEDFRKQ
jgi:hypothetical protein